MSLITLVKSVNKGWLKDVLTGAGLTLCTSAVTLTALDTAISTFKGQLGQVSQDILGLAHIAGFDYAMSIILGAIVARQVQSAGKLSLQKLAK